jgi:hypothetical protein
MSGKKIVTLDNGPMVVRSAKLPAEKGATSWRMFNQFAADAEKLCEYVRDLDELRWSRSDDDCSDSSDVEVEAAYCEELVAKVKAGFELFERAENYDEGVLKHEHVAKRLGILVGSFPNANPHSPQGYARMLIEHVAAIEDLSDIALESACRALVEMQKFAPAISEIVATINKHIEQWSARESALGRIDNVRARTIEILRKREQEQAKQEREREVREACQEAQRAMQTTQRLAKEIEAEKAKLATLIEQHAAAEKRESELLRELRKVARPPEEADAEAEAAAAEAATRFNGSGPKLV